MRMTFVMVAMLLLFACVSLQKLKPTQADVIEMQSANPTVTLEELQQGYKRYVDKCSGCHRLRNPAVYSETAWQSWLVKMFKKAKISDMEQQRLIRQFAQSKRIALKQ